MSTNFYFELKDEKLKQIYKLAPILQDSDDIFRLKIANRTSNSIKLYDSIYYTNTEDMLSFYHRNSNQICIKDEYGKILTADELISELIEYPVPIKWKIGVDGSIIRYEEDF